MYTYVQAFEAWKEDIRPAVVAQYGAGDLPALNESWSDYTDGLCKDGELSALQYHYCPSWDEVDRNWSLAEECAFVLDAMGLKFSATSIVARTDGAEGFAEGARHWRVMLQRTGAELVTEYTQGPAITDDVEAQDVVWSLLMDTSGIEGVTFEQWADEYGLNTDSRKAERMFKACQDTLSRLGLLFKKQELEDLRELFQDF